jgi:Cohesin domain
MNIRLTALALAAVMTATQAEAVSLHLTTPVGNVTVGSTVAVTIGIAGLSAGAAPGVGAFDLDIRFDAALLGFQSASFGTGLDVFGLGNVQTVTLGTGTVNLFEVALDTPADLIANQSSGFRLATLTFSALAAGTSALTINLNALSDAAGGTLPAALSGTSITVAAAIPEPQAYLLMLSGLAVLAGASRGRRSTARAAAQSPPPHGSP